jgi:hypothetical protein
VSAECNRTGRGASAQASVEFVALLPLLAALMVIAAQTVVVGWVLWSAGNAARAGARAQEVGSDAQAAARHALPGVLRQGAAIKDADGVRVQVRIPALVPGVDLPSVTAASRLDETAG